MNAANTQIVVGGPGCGKTRRLIGFVEEALSSGVRPNRIGFISFTKNAAEVGKERACEKFSLSPEDLPHFRTVHSFAFKYLGMRRDQMVSWKHLRELGTMLGMEFKGRGQVEDGDVYGMNSADRMMFLDGLSKNKLSGLEQVWREAGEDDIDWFELERFSRSLSLFKKSRALSDFNDLITRFCDLPATVLPELDLLVVDEVQDTSPLQWKAIELLASRAKQIVVGGDDRQAIYSWSGADVEKFISLPGRQITLDQSWRIPATVHALAESIAKKISHKREQVFKPREDQGSINWFSGLEEVDLSSGTWLLLARNGYMLNDLEDFCLSQGFSFHSINRDPLKSPALLAIRTWENLRKGREESSERVLEVVRYIEARFVPAVLVKKLKANGPSAMVAMPELVRLGLGSTAIWHEALTKISPKERDYFIAARRRGEALLKEPRIKISTIHASKGGQADHVLLLTDMSYRCFNNMEKNLDDELRVWYVAATRCKETLNLVMPKTNLNFEF